MTTMNTAFEKAARAIGCDVAAIKAVGEVESSGRALDSAGAPIRRFEPHHFPDSHWVRIGFAPKQGEAPWRASLRLSTTARARMFAKAAEIDYDAACVASSWGAYQIMGFNAKAAGYSTAAAMVAAFKDEAEQLAGFVRLVLDWGLDGAIRAHDWLTFAARYNGTGQAPTYAAKIESAYKVASNGQRSPEILRIGSSGQSVADMQQVLADRGWLDQSDVDAYFGPKTLTAVKQLQADANITGDGVVGAQTWAVLAASSKTPIAPKTQPTKGEVDIEKLAKTGAAAATAATGVLGAAGNLGETPQAILIGAACLIAVGWLVLKFALPKIRGD